MIIPISSALSSLRARIPDVVFRYGFPVASFVALVGVVYLARTFLGLRNPVMYILGILYVILLLGSAWLGYGTGLLICFLALATRRILGTTARTLSADAISFLVMGIISVLISRLGQTSRRREADLRHAAEELEVRVRQRTEEAVRSAYAMRETLESIREQAQLLDLAHDAILSLDRDYTIHFWNLGAERMYGWSREDALGKIFEQLLKTQFPVSKEAVESKLLSKDRWEGEVIQTGRDGTLIRVASRWTVRRDAEGRSLGFLVISTDITEKRRIEEQLQHTQKLESLGILAGGVAHDFNNLLTGILGNASLALDRLPQNYGDRALLQEVVQAAERAADLTRQLLAYAGKGRFDMRTVDLSGLVREISGLVKMSIPKHVNLRLQLAEGLRGVDADPGQLQQVVMNLVINGAEAIASEGGTVTVRTNLQPVDTAYIATMSSQSELMKPGDYICLEIHDTGSGMSEETIASIFDPFFTTKFVGRGLGLSAVLGIVRAHQGALKVYSAVGSGTTFRVLFPASAQPVTDRRRATVDSLKGGGMVMVVDDEQMVRQMARNSLEHYGYSVLTAENGAAAIEKYRRLRDGIILVLLDLTMPVMNGEQALLEMQQVNPQVRVLLSSGFNEVESVERFVGKGLAGFIQKPYTAAGLAEKVKEVLAR